MAWDAQGKWIPDDKAPAETASVTTQQQQLTGLLAGGAPAGAQTMTAAAKNPGYVDDSGMAPALPAGTGKTGPTRRVDDSGMGPTPGSITPGGPPPAGGTGTGPNGQPLPGDATVEGRLNGLLDSNSPYMRLARTAGQRNAARRGLLNSSIAGGASEAAAIAAAAPIASQDAQQAFQRGQTQLEGDLQLRNATTLQSQQDSAAAERLNLELGNRITLQDMGDASAMERLIQQGGIEKALQELRNSNDLTQTQINANVSLLSNYMQAFATLSQNPELPASARDAYMREFLRVTQSGQALVQALSGVSVTWPGAGGTTGTNRDPNEGGLGGGARNRSGSTSTATSATSATASADAAAQAAAAAEEARRRASFATGVG